MPEAHSAAGDLRGLLQVWHAIREHERQHGEVT
jgi:hypothetical protein